MRYSQSEKMDIIRMVEDSELSIKQTLKILDVPKSTFYGWYQRYGAEGYDGLDDHTIGRPYHPMTQGENREISQVFKKCH